MKKQLKFELHQKRVLSRYYYYDLVKYFLVFKSIPSAFLCPEMFDIIRKWAIIGFWGAVVPALVFAHTAKAEYCISAKCTCALNSVRCIMMTEQEDILGKLSPDFVGLGFGQSRVVFASETPVQFPNIQYIGLMSSTYHFKTPVNPFPSLQTLDLQSGTKYLGFPPNKIKQLSIDASPNLMGKPLLKVLQNVSVEFPEVEMLKLTNMYLTFSERDWYYPPIVFPHLKQLDLTGNMIESLLVLNKISQWWKLYIVILNNNRIRHVPLSHIKQIADAEFEKDAIVRLQMSSQKMICSCYQMDFLRWLRATEFFEEPRHIKCSYESDAKHVEFSLLEVAYLCDTERKSTAVNVYGVGKMKSSLVALIATSTCVGILALCVLMCHYRKVLKGLEKMRKFLCDQPM